MRELDQIASRIEAGGLGLEEGIAQYERGHELLLYCRRLLAEAEQRVHDLGDLPPARGAA